MRVWCARWRDREIVCAVRYHRSCHTHLTRITVPSYSRHAVSRSKIKTLLDRLLRYTICVHTQTVPPTVVCTVTCPSRSGACSPSMISIKMRHSCALFFFNAASTHPHRIMLLQHGSRARRVRSAAHRSCLGRAPPAHPLARRSWERAWRAATAAQGARAAEDQWRAHL